jgi:hypothetical protein
LLTQLKNLLKNFFLTTLNLNDIHQTILNKNLIYLSSGRENYKFLCSLMMIDKKKEDNRS